MRAALVLVLASSPALADKVAPPPCVQSGNPVLIKYERDALEFCTDSGNGPACYSVEPSNGRVFRGPNPSGKAPDTGWPTFAPKSTDATVTADDHIVKVCAPGAACKTIMTKLAGALRASANQDGTLVAVWPSGGGAKAKVEIYEVATRKRVGAFTAGTTDDPAIALSFAGDVVIVDESNGAGPDDTAWLATKAGKRIAKVGGANPLPTISLGPVRVKDDLWAFNSSEGDVVAIQDVKTGKVQKTIAVGAKVNVGSAQMTGDARRLVLLLDRDDKGPEVAVVELATDKVTHHPLAACKP